MRVKLRLRPLSEFPSVPPLPEAVPETVPLLGELTNAEPVWGELKAVPATEVPRVPCETESFEIVNWVAAGGHLFNAVLTLVIGDDKQYRIYDTYASWTPTTALPRARPTSTLWKVVRAHFW